MLEEIAKGTRESLDNTSLLCIRQDRKQRRSSRWSDMPIIAMMSGDTKTLEEQRGITLTLPPKEGGTGRLPKRLPTPLEKVQNFQRGLYLKAKRKEEMRFYSLYDKVYSGDVLFESWKRIRANKGCAGVDGKTIGEIEENGTGQFLKQIQKDLKEKTYKPECIRRVYIPKPNGDKRPLGIPIIKDRVIQMAVKIVIEPIFEADFQDCSYGFRPKRSAHQSLKKLKGLMNRGYSQVIDADLKSYFDTIPHSRLLELIAKRITDKNILKLINLWLKAGVVSEGAILRNSITGTPQGGVISPLLANIYLNELDKLWRGRYERQFNAYLIRYADDFLILTGKQPPEVLKTLQMTIEGLNLKLNEEKTKILNMEKDKLTFLGFSFKKVYDIRRKVRYIISFPSAKAMKMIRGRIRELTSYRIPEKVEVIISRLNPVIRGWSNYFIEGNSSKWFGQLRHHLENKIRRFIQKRRLKEGFGFNIYPDQYLYKKLGLYYLTTNRLRFK
jgi:group II intron reverse transcriptase/maturase